MATTDDRPLTVGQVAKTAGITVRTLHHYDALGLVRASGRAPNGYRVYTEGDILRLQQVLLFRELGMALGDIRDHLDAPDFDWADALVAHRRGLVARRDRLTGLIRAVDDTLMHVKDGRPMSTHDILEPFDASRYEAEARERWGNTEAWRQSTERLGRLTPAEREAVGAEQRQILVDAAALADRDVSDPEVLAAVGRMHRFISARFYDCSLEMFRGLGDLAIDDPRFERTYNAVRPGFAAFWRRAVHAYCDAQGG